MLLSGAGLLVRSFQNLRDLDPGFDPHHVVAISLPVSGSEHAPADRRAAFYREVVAQLRAMPGVQAASAVNHVPIAGDLFRLGVVIEGRPAPRPGDAPRRPTAWRCPATSKPSECDWCADAISTNATTSPRRRSR